MPLPLAGRSFRRILLIKPSALGDVINTVPVLVKLRRRYPEARIDWLLTPPLADWLRHHPCLSGVVPFDRQTLARAGRSWTATRDLLRFLWSLRTARYDLVIDLHGQFRSALLVLATGAATRVGFDRPRRQVRQASRRSLPESAYQHGWTGTREGAWLAYSHRIPVPTLDVHAIDRYLWLGPLLGLDDSPPDMRLPIPDDARQRATQLRERHGLAGRPFALLFAGTQWETKHWHSDGFITTARHLMRRGLAVALAGAGAEQAACRAVAAGCPEARDLCGKTGLGEMAALIDQAEVCVTNDSGPMHLAVALGRPVVSVFGPTDPVWVGPYGRPDAVARVDLPCSPCYLRRLARCAHGHACMQGVTADMVIERLERALSAVARPAA
jgi:lipopolysaccharide heptosyltransferase I